MGPSPLFVIFHQISIHYYPYSYCRTFNLLFTDKVNNYFNQTVTSLEVKYSHFKILPVLLCFNFPKVVEAETFLFLIVLK